MKRIGDKALTFRLPAMMDGGLNFVDPDEFLGQWVVLSFVLALGEFDSELWNEQGKEMESLGATLLVVPLEAKTLHGGQLNPPDKEHFTIVEEIHSGGCSVSMVIRRCCHPDGHVHFWSILTETPSISCPSQP